MLTAPPRDADVSLPNLLSTSRPPADADALDTPVLTWTVHLLRGQTSRLPRIGLCVLLVLLGGGLLFHNVLPALASAAALLLSLSEFLFPIRFTLTRRCAQARQGPVVWEIGWRDVAHAYLAPDGVKLSPLPRPGSRLEPMRGVLLRFAGNEEAVMAAVRRLREEARADA